MKNKTLGILPLPEVIFLKENMNLSIFVEGGTYLCATALKAEKYFDKVFTIEKSTHLFELAKKKLANKKNIRPLNGDTRDHLENIAKQNDNILYWLDAHWSGGETYGEMDECPLIEELNIIFKYEKKCVILIDDARLFLAPPPNPHELKNWPTIKEIVNVMPEDWELISYEDVIYLLPKEVQLNFRKHLQIDVSAKWLKFNKKKSIFTRVLNKIGIEFKIFI